MDQRTDTDVIDELTTDHREALDLLDRISSITDPDERRDLADTMISEVVRHSVAEEMYVYPAMREHLPDGEQAVKHDTEEHQQLEEIMKQLEAVQPSEPRFDALVRDMSDKLLSAGKAPAAPGQPRDHPMGGDYSSVTRWSARSALAPGLVVAWLPIGVRLFVRPIGIGVSG